MTQRDEEHAVPAGLTLEQVARLVGGRVEGDPDIHVHALRPIDQAGPGELGLLASKRYVRYAPESTAGAVLVSEEFAPSVPPSMASVVVTSAHEALPSLIARLHPPPPARRSGVHPTAVIGHGVRLGQNVTIEAYVVLDDGAVVGDGTWIGAHSVVGSNVDIGEQCHIYPHVVVYPGTRVGARVRVHAGARLGADGFGYTQVEGAHRKIPQVGGCVIEDDVEIGANTTIDRGSIGDTVLGHGVKVDNLVQIAHNVRIGPHTLVAALVGVAGSTRIGTGVWMGGQAGAIGHLDIGDGARIAVATKVLRDVPSGETVSGHPARPHREDLRRQAHLTRIPKLLDRLDALEEEVRQLRVERSDGDGSQGREDAAEDVAEGAGEG